jgi:hypothetical protein
MFSLAFDNLSAKALPIFQNLITIGFFLVIVSISGILGMNKFDK